MAQSELLRSKNSMSTKDFIAVGLIILSIAIVGFFTYDQYYSYIANTDTIESLAKEEQGKKTELDRLNAFKQSLADPKIAADVERYAGEYREDAYISTILISNPNILVSSVSMDKGERLPSGMSVANTSISFQAQNQDALVKYLDYLTGQGAGRRFFVKSLTFPYDSAAFNVAPITVSAKLGSYYLSR